MFDVQRAKRPENDRSLAEPVQKTGGTKQYTLPPGNRAHVPLFTQLWGNQPPPWLRLSVQRKEAHEALQKRDEPSTQRQANTTGLPDTLKAGVEQLSGLSLDDVQVHYNSSEPEQVQALAYTQGTHIHVGPGQEKHLAHEAWHVVQQKQGRVQTTLQVKGVAINDDNGLEREADMMGEMANAVQHGNPPIARIQYVPISLINGPPIVQREIQLTDVDAGIYEEVENGRFASGLGELYFTGQYYNQEEKEGSKEEKKVAEVEKKGSRVKKSKRAKGMPIFVQAGFIDLIREEIERSVGEQGEPKRAQIESYEIISQATKAKFYTDKQEVTKELDQTKKEFCLRQALRAPLLANPNKARGLQHRFADPEGVLFSKHSKEETEKRLKMTISEKVNFYHVLAIHWHEVIAQHKGWWTEVSEDFAYGRHKNLPLLSPRAQKSKFRQGSQSAATDERFQGDTLKDKLPPVKGNVDTDWIEYKAYARRKEREAGQYKAMSDWNALAYAAYMYHHGHNDKINLNQDWEWLHVRGAQNGGETTADNLVAGTSTTNSRMIPWEDTINLWTKYASPDQPLSVRFEGKHVPGTNLGQEIKISVAAEQGLPGVINALSIKKSGPITLTFHPLDGTVYDKISQSLTRGFIATETAKESAGVKAYRKYFINAGPYKGYYVEIRGTYDDKVTVITEATHQKLTVHRSMISMKTLDIM